MIQLPRARNRVLHGVENLLPGHYAATMRNAGFEQRNDFTGGQVRVKVPGDSKKPIVNTFTGSRRAGKQVVQEGRQFAALARRIQAGVHYWTASFSRFGTLCSFSNSPLCARRVKS